MVKSINRIIIFSSILFIFLITGCKNFMNGGDFLENLNDSVAYAVDKYVPVIIDADMDIIKDITPAKGTYESSYKKGDTILLSLTERKEYAFINWAITPEENIKLLNDGTLQDTDLRFQIINSDSDITIKPVCVKRPTIELLPEYRSDGVAKNSSIILKFSNPIEFQESTIEDIKIDCGGTDYKEYFNTAVLSEDKTQISFTSLRNKLIPAFSGIKSIDVIVPQDFSYNAGTAESPFLISFYEQQELTYRINNRTIEQIKVTGVDIPEKGSLTKVGEDTLNFDEQVEYHFTANKEYVVMGWTVKDSKNEDANDIPEDIIERIEAEDHKSVTLIFKAAPAGIEEVYLIPNVVEKQKLILNFSSENATLVPSEQKTYYTGEEFTIDCREENTYFFNRWRVYDQNGEEITDYSEYFEVENDKMFNHSVTLKVLSKSANLTFKPELIQRPSIVSTTPLYDSEGVYKDRRITVMFDTKLDEDSIYYTENEFKALGEGYTALRVNGTTGKIYGYQKTGDDSSIVYKAFEITMLNNQSVNLLKYYGIPTFDDGNTGVLKLGPKSTTVTPPGSTDILVKVKKDIGVYTQRNGQKELVSIPSDYKWAYYTNQESDGDAPSFVNESIELYLQTQGHNDYNSAKTDQRLSTTTFDKVAVELNNAKTSSIWVKAQLEDKGSGPESITVNIYRDTEHLTDIYPVNVEENKVVMTKKFTLSLESQVGHIFTRDTEGNPVKDGCSISLFDSEKPELSLPEEGIYYIELIGTDKNGIDKKHNEKFYFVWDVNAPEKPEKISYSRKEIAKSKISCTASQKDDYCTTVFERFAKDDESFATVLESHETQQPTNLVEFSSNLVDKTNYKYRIRHKDYAGNYSEPLVFVNNEKPVFSFTETAKKSSTTFYDNEFEYLDGKVRIIFDGANVFAGHHVSIDYKKKYNDANLPRHKDLEIKQESGKNVVDLPLYRNGYQYTFDIKLTDFDGLESDKITIETKTYIIEDSAQGGTIGQFVLFGDIEKFSGMAKVLEEETDFYTYNNTEESLQNLMQNLATDIYNDSDLTTKNAIIAAQQEKTDGTGSTDSETILKNLKSQIAKFDNKDNKKYKDYITRPGVFTNVRIDGQNDTVKIKPYEIAKYEMVAGLAHRIEYDYRHNFNSDYSIEKSTNPIISATIFIPIKVCNTMSLIYGFEPCYTLYRDEQLTQKIEAEEWAYEWVWNNTDGNKKSNNYSNYNNLICDFTKNGFRIPTELEWECAARGGSQKRYDSEYDILPWFLMYATTANKKDLYDNDSTRAGPNSSHNSNYIDLADLKTRNYKPNYLGLWLMSGNVMEWCWDVAASANSGSDYGNRAYENIYGKDSSSDESEGKNGPFGSNIWRSVRGGSWKQPWNEIVIGTLEFSDNSNFDRQSDGADTDSNKYLGYRVARTIDPVADNSESHQ